MAQIAKSGVRANVVGKPYWRAQKVKKINKSLPLSWKIGQECDKSMRRNEDTEEERIDLV